MSLVSSVPVAKALLVLSVLSMSQDSDAVLSTLDWMENPMSLSWFGLSDPDPSPAHDEDEEGNSGSGIIVPGTLWCGQGNVAKSFDQLGVFAGPDRCCRDHDFCPDYVPARSGGRRHGLLNPDQIPAALCACDHKLLQCLRADGSAVAGTVGIFFFDVLKPRCFTFDYPVVRCRRTESPDDAASRCVDYERDNTSAQTWHFEDFPFFYGSDRVEEVDVAAKAAAALAAQEQPEVAANGKDAELWNALLENRHVRFGPGSDRGQTERSSGLWGEALRVAGNLVTYLGKQVYPEYDN